MSSSNCHTDAESLREDAERYRWLRDRSKLLSYTHDLQGATPMERLLEAVESFPDMRECIEIKLPLYHVTAATEPFWTPDEHFDWAKNMDAAIDAALAREKELSPDETKVQP